MLVVDLLDMVALNKDEDDTENIDDGREDDAKIQCPPLRLVGTNQLQHVHREADSPQCWRQNAKRLGNGLPFQCIDYLKWRQIHDMPTQAIVLRDGDADVI